MTGCVIPRSISPREEKEALLAACGWYERGRLGVMDTLRVRVHKHREQLGRDGVACSLVVLSVPATIARIAKSP